MEISDNVRANRDFWVELLLDEGWAVKKGMIGLLYATDLLGKLPSISIRRLAAEREKETSCWSFQSMQMSPLTGRKNRILLIFLSRVIYLGGPALLRKEKCRVEASKHK